MSTPHYRFKQLDVLYRETTNYENGLQRTNSFRTNKRRERERERDGAYGLHRVCAHRHTYMSFDSVWYWTREVIRTECWIIPDIHILSGILQELNYKQQTNKQNSSTVRRINTANTETLQWTGFPPASQSISIIYILKLSSRNLLSLQTGYFLLSSLFLNAYNWSSPREVRDHVSHPQTSGRTVSASTTRHSRPT